jgi:PIN domain nuclease of toxin-antitoxin system
MSDSTAAEAERPNRVLLDTHVLVWHMEGSKKIGKWAQAAVEAAAESDAALVSAITPWEIALLVSKGRLKLGTDVMDWLRDALASPGLQVAPLEPEIAVASTRLPFEIQADPADRILAATARHLGATFVTADKALLDLAKKGHFRAMDAAK